MKSRRIAGIVVLSLVGVVVAGFVVRFATIKGRTAAKSIEEIQADEGIPVDVQVLRKGTISRYLEITGTALGVEQVNIVSSIPLDITGIAAKEGDRVSRGDVIIRLARDRGGKAFYQYTSAKQALDNAKNDLERTENLYREGAASGQMLEQARLAYESAKAQYDQAASVVDLASPIDGVVTMVSATIGSEAEPGVALATVASLERMRIRCFVGHTEIAQLKAGQRAYVQPPAAARAAGQDPAPPDTGIEGDISRVSLSSDPVTKLFLVEVTCDNTDSRLRPGMIAGVSVLIDEEADALTVPGDAVIERDGKSYVYRVSSNVARLTEVTLGTDNGREIGVAGGVAEGDTVVFRGQYRVTDGARVKIHEIEGMK